jgi:hypothetical protein
MNKSEERDKKSQHSRKELNKNMAKRIMHMSAI